MAENRTGIQRILVALDASSSSLSALQNAVELAERLGAELIGLFVEDINLVRLAQLPLAWEVSAFSPSLRRMDALDMERQLRAQAIRMRQIMSKLCDQREVSWQFKVSRGPVAAELLGAAVDADLMVIGKIGSSFPGPKRTGRITRMIVSRRPGMTLVLQTGARLTYPVILVYDGSEQARKAVDAASHLTKLHDGRLTVLVAADSKDDARRFEVDAMDRLQVYRLGADFRLMIRYSLGAIAKRIRFEGHGPVVIPCDTENDEEEQLCALVDEVSNPVLLVR